VSTQTPGQGMQLLSFTAGMSGFNMLVITAVAYFVAGTVVSFAHPSLVRRQFADLRATEFSVAGWIVKPVMGLLVFLMYCVLWPVAWFNAGKSEKKQSARQAAQLERLRPFWRMQSAITAPVKYAGGDGSSFEDAVVVIGGTILSGPHAEYAYLERHFPGYECREQRVRQHKGRTFDVLQFTTTAGEKKVMHFDISGHLAEPQ
jgi:hypothetical protein